MIFKIGDTIKVIDSGALYSSYEEMAKQLGADIDGKWKRNGVKKNIKGKTGVIKNITPYARYILIELDSGHQWIIGPTGIEKIDIILPDEMFEI